MCRISVIPYSTETYNQKGNFLNDTLIKNETTLFESHQMKTLSSFDKWNEEDWYFFYEFGSEWKIKILEKLSDLKLLDKTILWMSEPNVVEFWHDKKYLKFAKRYFAIIFTMDLRLVDNERIFYLPAIYPEIKKREANGIEFDKKKLLCNISGNKNSFAGNELYSARREIINYFEENHSEDFDLYGRGWENEKLTNFVCECEDKTKTYQKYKFALAFENAKDIPGYVTEKIYDCIAAGIVPIYFGAPNISDYVPPDCYISWDQFKNIDEMYAFLKKMDYKDYMKYIEAQNKYIASGGCQYKYYNNWEDAIINAIKKYKSIGYSHKKKMSTLDNLRIKCFFSKNAYRIRFCFNYAKKLIQR